MKENKLHALQKIQSEEDAGLPNKTVSRPGFNWKLRVLVPGLVLGGFFVLLGLSAYEELTPAAVVQESPVLLKTVQTNIGGTVTVQAAGWLEADPFKSYVTGLTDGIVSEVLVLEGQSVIEGQVVVRLVDEDSRLAEQRAEDKVKELEATLGIEKAELQAAISE